MTTTNNQSDYLESSFREKMLEHIFLAEILQGVWLCRDKTDKRNTVEMLKPEVDSAGYDLVLEYGGVRRYIQLKSSKSDSKKRTQTVNSRLANKAGGCIVWLFYEETEEGVKLRYWFYGGHPSMRPILGNKLGKRTTANARGVKPRRLNTCVINKTDFKELCGVDELIYKLFGVPKPELMN